MAISAQLDIGEGVAVRSYSEFLSLLLEAGHRLSDVWPEFKSWLRVSQELDGRIISILPVAVTGLSSETAEMEIRVGLLASGPNEKFEGNFLRVAYQFLVSNPELMAFAVLIFKRLSVGP